MHSIIIPHRDRNLNLQQCLWSIARSAWDCGITDYEVIIVDNGSASPPTEQDEFTTVIHDTRPLPAVHLHKRTVRAFCKGRELNLGIDAATGDVITFLDADAVVGRGWMWAAAQTASLPLTRLCYRVRYLPKTAGSVMEDAGDDRHALADGWFDDYDALSKRTGSWKYPMGFEGYGVPEAGNHPRRPSMAHRVFGNSQFSMTRKKLGKLRYDEEYVGAGHEDLSFVRTIARHYGNRYCAEIITEPNHAMFHIFSKREGTWGDEELGRRGESRYNNTRGRKG